MKRKKRSSRYSAVEDFIGAAFDVYEGYIAILIGDDVVFTDYAPVRIGVMPKRACFQLRHWQRVTYRLLHRSPLSETARPEPELNGSSQQITYQNWFRNTHRHSGSLQAGIPFFRGAGFRPKPCRNDRTALPGRLFVVSCLRPGVANRPWFKVGDSKKEPYSDFFDRTPSV